MRTLFLLLFAALPAFAVAPVITTSLLLPAGVSGTAYSLTLASTGVPTSWTQTGSLPTGLTFHTGTGVLDGTPTSTGTFPLALTATNADGSDGPRTYTLIVLATAICASVTGGWTCGDSGNATLNGRALHALTYSAPVYACGDIVTLAAGAKYNNFLNDQGIDKVRSFRMWPQTGCSGRITRFVSANLASIPKTLNKPGLQGDWQVADLAGKQAIIGNFAQLVGMPPSASPAGDTPEQVTVIMFGGGGNYYFGGIAIASPLGKDTGGMNYVAVGAPNAGPTMRVGYFSDNVEIDRCFVGNQEDYVYGALEDWYDPAKNAQADVNTWENFFRAGNIAIAAEGDNWNIHDSVIITTGFDPNVGTNPTFTCSGGTNANPAVIHCAGVAATLGITSSSCNPSSPAITCYPVSGQYAVLRGATGGWAGAGKLNGLKYLVYVGADDVAVYEGWKVQSFATPTAINSTSWGSYSGPVQGKATSGTIVDVQYGIVSQAGNHNVVIENNFISDQGGSSNIFLGGGWSMTNYRGNVLAGSVCAHAATASNTCVLNMSNVIGLSVGDWMWLSTINGEKIGGNLLDVTVSSNVATAHFTTLPPGVSVGQNWIVAGSSTAALNSPNSRTNPPYTVTSVGATSFTFSTVGVGGVPDGVYSSAGMLMWSRSPNCPAASAMNDNCALGVDRVGEVTNITGNAVTLTGLNVGFAAIDPGTLLDIGTVGPTWSIVTTYALGDWVTYNGLSYQSLINSNTGLSPEQFPTYWNSFASTWNGRGNRYWKVSANTLLKQPFGYGKSYVEVKNCQDCLFTGNLMCCTSDYDIFVENHKQGNDPWVTSTDFEYSYNIVGSSAGSAYRFFIMGEDPETSSKVSVAPRVIHNISADIPFAAGSSVNEIFDSVSGSPGSSYAHNTFLPKSGGVPSYKLYAGTDRCVLSGVNVGTYFQSVGTTITDSILGFGVGMGGAYGVCDPFPAGISNNVFLNDQGTSMPGWAASQNNSTVTTKAAIGFVGTCTTDSYINCALDPASAYKGTAPDGSDPGADVYAVQDRQNRWSELAGLIEWSPTTATMINKTAAFFGTSMQFTRFSSLGSCSMKLFTNKARTSLHADTASGHQACGRAGNSDSSGIVTFNFGTVAALTTGATYSYELIDGSRTMVGEFVAAAPTAPASSTYQGIFSGSIR